MSASPGRIIADIEVNLGRPRDTALSTDAAFVAIKRQCLEIIREETLRAFEQQNVVEH
jgi:NitT/TauT family transport system ATP-binding protein